MIMHIFILHFTILTLGLEWSIILIPEVSCLLCLLYFIVDVLGAFQEIVKAQDHPGVASFVQVMVMVP